MDNLLPKVSKEIFDIIQKSIVDSSDNTYFVTLITELEKENPYVARFVAAFSNKTQNTDVARCGILVYHLLKSQAEIDKLNSEYQK